MAEEPVDVSPGTRTAPRIASRGGWCRVHEVHLRMSIAGLSLHHPRTDAERLYMDVSPVQLLLDRLEATGLRYYESGRSFMAQCPSHDDDSPSLRITEGDDGRALLFCIAGCQTAQIVGELRMELRDLFVPRDKPLGPIKQKLVPVAGGGWATRAEREIIERETLALIRKWADEFVIDKSLPAHPRPSGRDWERAWDVAAARSGIQR